MFSPIRDGNIYPEFSRRGGVRVGARVAQNNGEVVVAVVGRSGEVERLSSPERAHILSLGVRTQQLKVKFSRLISKAWIAAAV